MHSEDLRQRTKTFSIRILELLKRLPQSMEARILGKQVIRSATSVAANYRAACRARSHAEFVAKLAIVVEEADETLFWLELIAESDIYPIESDLLQECKEILYIMSASRKTARDSKVRNQSTNH